MVTKQIDKDGHVIGYFLTPDTYQKLILAYVMRPIEQADYEKNLRLVAQGGWPPEGKSTAEVLEMLRILEKTLQDEDGL